MAMAGEALQNHYTMTIGPLTRAPDRERRQTGCRGPGRLPHRTPLGLERVAVPTKGGLRRTPTWSAPRGTTISGPSRFVRLSMMDCEPSRGHDNFRAALTAGSVGR